MPEQNIGQKVSITKTVANDLQIEPAAELTAAIVDNSNTPKQPAEGNASVVGDADSIGLDEVVKLINPELYTLQIFSGESVEHAVQLISQVKPIYKSTSPISFIIPQSNPEDGFRF